MKIVLLVMFGLMAVTFASSALFDADGIAEVLMEESFQRDTESDLLALMEKLRKMMKTGYEPLNIPILAPYKKDNLDINIDVPAMANIKLNIKEFMVEGLDLFHVNKISFDMFMMRLKFDITLPVTAITTPYYKIDGELLNGFDIFGNGTVDIKTINFQLKGNTTLTVKDKHLFMRAFMIDLNMKRFECDIKGLLGGGKPSEVISNVLQEMVPSLLVMERRRISEMIGKFVMDFANPYLTKLTLNDVIDIIEGNKPISRHG